MNYIKKWLQNGRSGSLVQSFMPAVLAVVLSLDVPGFNVWMALLAVLGVECAHLAMNIADDYFDYKVDMMGDRDRVIRKGFRAMTVKYPYLTDGSETLRSTLKAIIVFTAVAACCGGIIFFFRNGWTIPSIALATAFLGFFYSAPPFKLAYRGLGELVIGVIFGPLLMLGVYYASAHSVYGIIPISVPVGLLVTNILFTHSFIDLPGDAESNKMTFARLLGSDKANLAFSFILNFVPFIMVVAAVCMGSLHPAYLAVLLVLPRAAWLWKSLLDFSKGRMDVPEKAPAFLGNMGDWAKIRELGIDWFMMRWFTARNTLSGFCLLTMVVKIILIICSR